MKSTTNLQLAVIAAMLGIRWFPDVAYPVIIMAAIFYVMNQVPGWNAQRRKQKTRDAQEKLDEPLLREFRVKHKAIRDKYDPKHEWNEATSLPTEYEREMADLNNKYRAVLDRQFAE